MTTIRIQLNPSEASYLYELLLTQSSPNAVAISLKIAKQRIRTQTSSIADYAQIMLEADKLGNPLSGVLSSDEKRAISIEERVITGGVISDEDKAFYSQYRGFAL